MLELLFLLLPLAAAYGYYMGRNSLRSKKLSAKNRHNATYLRGVEYLFSNNQEKAVDKFIAYLNGTDPTFESRLALGNLLRQRGEFDKAIALHERMAADETLDDAEKELATLELSRDFLNAGVFNQAEELLKNLINIPRQRVESANLLLKVYEREGDYQAAITVAEFYSEVLGNEIKGRLADYWCEMGNAELGQGNIEKARSFFKKALNNDPKAVRPRLCIAETLLKQGRYNEAFVSVKDAWSSDPVYGLLCLDHLKRCFVNKADPKYRFALEDLVHRTNSASAMVELVKATELSSGADDAEAMLLNFLHDKANLKLFSALMELRSHKLRAGENDALMQLKSLMDAQIVQSPRFVCRKCGFESSVMFWQCPSCRRWRTLKPRHGIDGD